MERVPGVFRTGRQVEQGELDGQWWDQLGSKPPGAARERAGRPRVEPQLMGNAVDRALAKQAENEALKVSAQETTAALQETTAELKDMRGELKWLQLHIKREQAQEREPKRFRRELIVCAVVAVGATLLTLVTTLVLGNIIREIAIETFETLRVWWAE